MILAFTFLWGACFSTWLHGNHLNTVEDRRAAVESAARACEHKRDKEMAVLFVCEWKQEVEENLKGD